MTGPTPEVGFRIRTATPDDYGALIELWRISGGHVEPDARESRPAFLHQLAMFPGLYLVAMDADRIIGVALGTHDGRKGWINRLAVHPDHRRRGVAAALVTACDAALRARGLTIVTALVEADNDASAALFRKLGYEDLPVHYFRKPNP